MISETACSSQTKLIGLNLHVSEHGIGYSNLTPDPQAQWDIELILGPFMVHLGNLRVEADFCILTDFWPKLNFST